MHGDSRGGAATVILVDESGASLFGTGEIYTGSRLTGGCNVKVSLEALHKAIEFAESFNECQIRSLSVLDKKKDNMVRLVKIRLKEIEVRMSGLLNYWDCLIR